MQCSLYPLQVCPIVISANIIVDVPNDGTSKHISLSEIDHPLCVTEVAIVLPEKGGIDNMHICMTGTINDIKVNVMCCLPDFGEVPHIDVKLVETINLDSVGNLLQLGNIKMADYLIPLVSKSIKDVTITDFGFTLKQRGHQVQSCYLSKVCLGVEFNNIDKYLPSYFSNLKSFSSQVVVLQLKHSFPKIAIEVNFMIQVQLKNGQEVSLTCQFSTRPVSTGHSGIPSSYDFTVLIQSDIPIGNKYSGVSVMELLGIFGFQEPISQTQAIPFIHSLFEKVELKRILLGMNTSSKNITSFGLDVSVSEWELTKNILINAADISMSYIDKTWNANFEAEATLLEQYFVTINFQLYHDTEVSIRFKSSNDEFTLSKFLDTFSLGQINNVPVVGQLLSIAITEAYLKIHKSNEGKVMFNEGKISLYIDALNISSQLHLSEVNATVSFISNKDSYSFSFAVSGFINDKMYIDVQYDHNTSILSGTLSIVSYQEASLTEVFTALITDSKSIDNNDVFKSVSDSPSVHVSLALKYDSKTFVMKHFVIQVKKELSIGPHLSLNMIRFGYDLVDQPSTASALQHQQSAQQKVYVLVGDLVNKHNKTGAILKFDLTTNSTG